MRRGDRDGDCAVLLDHIVVRPWDDHQMAVRSRTEDMPALVQQIGAYPAADLGPALGEVAIELRRGRANWLGSVHVRVKPRKARKVPTAVTWRGCRKILRNRAGPSALYFKNSWKFAVYSNWHAHCYYVCVHLVPRHEGAVQRFSGPAAPPLPRFRLRRPAIAAARRSRTPPS